MCKSGVIGNEMVNFLNVTEEFVPGCILILDPVIYHTLLIPPKNWRLPACSKQFREHFREVTLAINYPKKFHVTKLAQKTTVTHLISKGIPTLKQLTTAHVIHCYGQHLSKMSMLPQMMQILPATFSTLVTDVTVNSGIFRNCKHQVTD
jgi:hypothetical protein